MPRRKIRSESEPGTLDDQVNRHYFNASPFRKEFLILLEAELLQYVEDICASELPETRKVVSSRREGSHLLIDVFFDKFVLSDDFYRKLLRDVSSFP
jgi:hypothetical protein